MPYQSSSEHSELGSDQSLCEDQTGADPIKHSTAYAQNHVGEHLHPAFVDSGFRYDTDRDCFAAEFEEKYDEAALLDGQQAFTDALQRFQEGIEPKYKSKVDLTATHTWTEVIEYAEVARKNYTGVEQKGIARKVNNGLKKFQTAAPAIEAWLKLLPSTSCYGSVAAVNLRKLRKETLNALDQIPQCVEKAEFLMRTYGYVRVNIQVGNLYLAILDALQYILEWYHRAAGSESSFVAEADSLVDSKPAVKFFSAFWRGPAYAERLKNKMKDVDLASQAMSERASQSDQRRLQIIVNNTAHTNDQVEELKTLAIEARNHLYEVLKDTELWREAMQDWKQSRLQGQDQRMNEHQATLGKEGDSVAARKSLLASLGAYHDDSSRDMERVLAHITSMTLGDQDRLMRLSCWKLLKLFRRLLRRSTTEGPVVCILDGLSFYETRHQSSNLGRIISELAKLAKSDSPRLILLFTSPIRTSYNRRQRKTDDITIAEISDHVSGAKQGLDSHHIMSATEKRARKMSESLGSRRKAT
ncbi:MAG: hypothetical protein LQ350_008503 [Teloschistes chrysophthalmus]|nr:MAG: hypothetical protein LQ350_008503 [Niorma chrysophthalma]